MNFFVVNISNLEFRSLNFIKQAKIYCKYAYAKHFIYCNIESTMT
jgi:hypothetical protein